MASAGFAAWHLPALLLLAAAMRLAGLGDASLWDDEAVTAAFAGLSWRELFTGVGLLEPNPPAFYGLQKLWITVAGTSELALRLPSALAGVAGVALLYEFVRSALGSRAALWTGLLLATNAQLVAHARDARVYALLFALTAGSLILVRRLVLQRSASWPLRLGLALLSVALIALHYTGVIIVGAIDAYALVLLLRTSGPRLRAVLALAAANLAAAIVNLPTFAMMASIAADTANNAHIVPADAITTGLIVLMTWASPGFPLRAFPAEVGMVSIVCGLVAVCAGAAWALVRMRRDPEVTALAAGAVAAVGLLTGISQVTPILVDRTLLFSLALFLPLLGGAFAAAPLPVRALLGGAVLCAQLPALALAYAPARNGGQDWRALAAAVQYEAAATGWPVIVRHGLDVVALEHYLPPGAPGRPAVALSPPIGARLSERVTTVMTGATPLDEAGPPSALCSLIGESGGALLVYTTFTEQDRMPARALLAAAGGHNVGGARFGPLFLERWPGACMPPR